MDASDADADGDDDGAMADVDALASTLSPAAASAQSTLFSGRTGKGHVTAWEDMEEEEQEERAAVAPVPVASTDKSPTAAAPGTPPHILPSAFSVHTRTRTHTHIHTYTHTHTHLFIANRIFFFKLFLGVHTGSFLFSCLVALLNLTSHSGFQNQEVCGRRHCPHVSHGGHQTEKVMRR
jgi:hypothetical protein